jgi:signal transduction histidine kinase
VKASFDGKHWSKHAKSMAIHVLPPWWSTIWFRVAAALCFLAILYSAYRVRVRFLRAQKKRLEYLVQQGTQEIQNLLKEVAEKNEALTHINEELLTQRDQLEEAQEKLKGINVNLEELVNKRTKKLNITLRELETFLYRASHDLRGPLSSMLGLIRVAAMENDTSPINKTYTDFLLKTTIKLERTLQKLMQKHSIQKSRINHEAITQSSFLRLLNEIPPSLPVFRAEDFEVNVASDIHFETDASMLNILMINLLENAFFFSERSPNRKVSLDVSQSDTGATISIMDRGPGIKQEVKDKIFTMFYRGNELSTGNGLGLYLVKSAVKKINGKITLETEEGRYSRFIITLPRVVA